MGNKLAKYMPEAKVSGVCAALARYSGIDVTIIRLGFVLAAVFWRWFSSFNLFHIGIDDARKLKRPIAIEIKDCL